MFKCSSAAAHWITVTLTRSRDCLKTLHSGENDFKINRLHILKLCFSCLWHNIVYFVLLIAMVRVANSQEGSHCKLTYRRILFYMDLSTSLARCISSWNEWTTIASALVPLTGVPILLPSPRIGRSLTLGFTSVADSSPRTQCGTWRPRIQHYFDCKLFYWKICISKWRLHFVRQWLRVLSNQLVVVLVF